MIIDLTPLVQALAALVLAALSAATPYFVPLLRRYLRLKLTAAQASVIQTAADVGAQAAYGYIATSAATYRDVTIRNEALAKGVQHVMASAPDALTSLGITPDHVRQMVEARFGGLLANDPNVSIAAPPPAAA
jgi:hypothetical protein